MISDLEDTIVAQASVPGAAVRGIVRLSGPKAFEIVNQLFHNPDPSQKFQSGSLRIQGLESPLPALVLRSNQPNTYTGQDLVEIHLIGCPPVVDALLAEILNRGARSANPGEFTLRGFLNGKRDLTQSEAVLAVIEARDSVQLKQALNQMAGGVSTPLVQMREDLLNLLADVEAGLDFSEEDIEFIDRKDLLLRLGKALAQLTNLRRQLEDRAVEGRMFRVALVGKPNAGKSSLFNALAGDQAAIVSPVAGTTRDYVTRSIQLSGQKIELIDTAGWMRTHTEIDEQAQHLGRERTGEAELILECIESTRYAGETSEVSSRHIRILTKCDLHPGPEGWIRTSSETFFGLAELQARIVRQATDFFHPALASSLSRCRHHVDRSILHLRNAHNSVLFEDPAEILAAEVRLALDQLGEMTGAIYTEDLLGRIFSRFCVGK
ncbi:tRNA modification GTPase [Telmatocola sphagniphila]|uniref:tRNA modification GTPase MnmE n=1 Tax=Telmatocola sphagniphila TaxID=1123043 RepID=A0A8E6B8E0_9BACT|nr:tRNA modification GTPase [Telmatocola sphagniphila]QVL33159.1 tRNA modification GTPase [Telmatocola sphagniphila]